MRGIQLAVTTVIILIVLLVVMLAIIIFFKGGFEVTGGVYGEMAKQTNATATDIYNDIISLPSKTFGFE